MKLIIVNRSKPEVYARLREQFAGDRNVKVVFEQRKASRLETGADRRRLQKSTEGRDYIVVHTADEEAYKKRK